MKRLSKTSRSTLRDQLLTWYEANKRDLAWRRTDDPYKIWVSEIMLQQTQVKTVEPYYERFLQKFPTLESLALANLDEVLKQWEGLGYYSRARNLHKAANHVIDELAGKIPSTRKELQQLPGIGKYVSAALSSIAFGKDEVVIDGNVRRVFARILAIEEDPRLPEIERALESILLKILPKGQASQFNQAIMELGALICTPQNPSCTACPASSICEAQKKNLQALLPIRPTKRKRPHSEVAIGIIWKDEKLLITKRPEKGLLAGLWEFPGGKQESNETLEECLHREILEEVGLKILINRKLTSIDHGYTHLTVTIHPFECRWIKGEPQNIEVTDFAWVEPHELAQYAFPRANQKIFQELFREK